MTVPPSSPSWDSRTLLTAQAMAHVGVWEWNAADGEVRWSRELCRIYGFDPDTFEHDFGRFMATVVPEDRPLVDDAMARAFTDGEGFEFELRIVGEDDRRRTLHAVGQVTADGDGRPLRILGITQDITARKQAEDALGASERRFRAAFDDAPIGMALVGLDGAVLRANHALAEILGRPVADLPGLDFREVTHPDDLADDLAAFERLLAGDGEAYSLEKRYLRPDGEVVWTRLSVSVVRGPEGSSDYFVSQIQDVSSERQLREHLHELADRDGLTGLLNRRRFDDDLDAQARRTTRYDELAAVVLLDLNQFKQVNDTHGHHAGDEVLRRVAAALVGRLRDSDSIARVGGDEFAALLINVGAEQAERVALELAAVVDAAAGHGVTASVGTAMLRPGTTPEQAMQAADRAMYAAKAAGRPPAPAPA